MSTVHPLVIPNLVIGTGRLTQEALAGEVIIVTGGGKGIAIEAARSLLWLGATVVIAEIEERSGSAAEAKLADVWGSSRVVFVQTDVGSEASVRRLVASIIERFGRVDVVLNNAAYAPVGIAVAETPIEEWDRSYAANLRGPVLLARTCVPTMIARRHGVFVCVSSTGGPYLGAYESLKAAQLAVANTLDAELEGTGVVAFTIGPGLVPTATAKAAIELLAPKLGTTVDEFWAANAGAVLSVEAAGAGFAAAIALADRYGGQEISSSQALIDAGIELPSFQGNPPEATVGEVDLTAIADACRKVKTTLVEQAAGWKSRSFFERQWMLRDFKQRVGIPVERCVEMLEQDIQHLSAGEPAFPAASRAVVVRLEEFYANMAKLAAGYVKDPAERSKQVGIVEAWRVEVETLIRLTEDRRHPGAGPSAQRRGFS